MQREIKEDKSDDAVHGDVIHKALATRNPEGLDIDQQDIYDTCCAIEKKLVMQFFNVDEATYEASKPFREQRYWVHWKDELQHSGQVDVAHRAGTRALIIDYKTLAGDVAGSPQNIQLRDLACLFDHNNPMLQEVGCVIIQPLVTHSPQICVYKREDLLRSMKEMHERVVASNGTNPTRNPGEMQCKFCKAAKAGTCQEYTKWASQLVTTVTTLMDKPLSEVMLKDWTPEQCKLFLDQLPIARKWLDTCETEMWYKLTDNPESIPGYKLKPGAKREQLLNPQNIFERFSSMGGSLTQFMECISVVKGLLKDEVAKATKTKGKALDNHLKTVIGEDHELSQNDPSIVKDKE